ncbi:MAG TPA: PIG-L family deacetylase, partial [Thermoplasmata archaeon]|nr:PIG-L family deacetylase [Thermoplasmata archaeon]
MASVIAVGAHPDDVEVGCFGTLLKHVKMGDEVGIILTTQGGYGSRSWETITSEMKRAQNKIGIRYDILDNPIGHYGMTWKTVSEIDGIIRERDADTIYSVWHGDSHQDHQMTFKNVLAACRTKRILNLYCYELPEYSYRSQET